MHKSLFLLVGGVFAYCISTVVGTVTGEVLRSSGTSEVLWCSAVVFVCAAVNIIVFRWWFRGQVGQ